MTATKILKDSTHQLKELNSYLSENNAGTSVNPSTFCILPFIQFSTCTDGNIHLCCRSQPIGAIGTDGLTDLWQSEKMNAVRQDLANGVRRSECKSCWELEDLGMVSLRQGQNVQRALENKQRITSWISRKSLDAPHTLELKLSNLCNLKCRMCCPADSTAWLPEWNSIKQFYEYPGAQIIRKSIEFQIQNGKPVLDHFASNKRFLADFSKIADTLQDLEFAGGEPLLDPTHYEILQRVLYRAPEIGLKYSTNLTTLGTQKFNVRDFWPLFKNVKVTVSIDGYGELNEYIRTGVKTTTLQKNIETLKSMPNVTLMASTCVSTYNALFIPETCDYIASLGISWHANRVRTPRFLDARVLPASLRAKAVQDILKFKAGPFTELNLNETLRHRSLRTLKDCVSWLEDPTKENTSYFEQFLDYKIRLDEIRRTSFSPLEVWLKEENSSNSKTEKTQAKQIALTPSGVDRENL